MFYGSDDEGLSVGAGGKDTRKNYLRDLASKGIHHGNQFVACGDSKDTEKTPEEIRCLNAAYSPQQLDDEQLQAQSRPSPGKNFDRFYDMPVEIIGFNISENMVIDTFSQVFWQETVLRNIQSLGYDKPTPIQQYAMRYIMDMRDVVACAPTGSGKTAAYVLPILLYILIRGDTEWIHSDHPAPCAIILVPTRELADQIKDEIRRYTLGTKIQTVCIYGGTNVRYQVEYIRRNGCNILVGTPGRVLQLLSEGRFRLCKCKYVVLDEAHQISGAGNDAATVRQILDFPGLPVRGHIRNTLLFSATFPKELQQLANEFLCDYVFIGVGKVGAANKDITQQILMVPEQQKFENLVSLVKGNETEMKTLVFVERKRVADFVASRLLQMGITAMTIHGDREQRGRDKAIQDFKSGRCPVLVATAVASRGLDIVQVDHVINYDLPQNTDDYVHRIGRTGRVGNAGRAITFYDPNKDKPMATALIQVLRDVQQIVPEWLLAECGLTASAGADDTPVEKIGGDKEETG